MPYLIDGNNLLHAMWSAGVDVSRPGLCAMLLRLAHGGQKVTAVFDGPNPHPGDVNQSLDLRLTLEFSGPLPADKFILEHIAADTAPHRLVVVSTDHEIRAAAHRRRCQSCRSEDFVKVLLRAPAQPPRDESLDRQPHLTEEETRQWLREFGFDADDPEKP